MLYINYTSRRLYAFAVALAACGPACAGTDDAVFAETESGQGGAISVSKPKGNVGLLGLTPNPSECTGSGGTGPIGGGRLLGVSPGAGGVVAAQGIGVTPRALLAAVGGNTGVFSLAVSVESNTTLFLRPRLFTPIPWKTVLYDKGAHFNASTGKVTVSTSGDYQVCASLATFNRDFEIDLFINDSRENAMARSKFGIGQGCRTVRLQANDNIDVRVYQDNSAGMYFYENTHWNWMTVDIVRSLASLDNIESFAAPEASFATVPYTAPLYDNEAKFNAQEHSYTAPVSGVYEICALAASFAQDFELDVFVDGVRQRGFALSKYGEANGCIPIQVQAASKIDVKLWQNRTASLPLQPNSIWNWLTIDFIFGSLYLAGNVSAFTAPSGSFVAVPYLGGSKLMATSSGMYQVCASLASFAQDFELDLFVNGSRENAFAISSYGVATGCRTIRLNRCDTVEIQVFQNSGVPVTFQPNDHWAWAVTTPRG